MKNGGFLAGTIYEECGLDLTYLSHALCINTTIQELSIGGKHLSAEDISILALGISQNKHLRELEVFSRRSNEYCAIDIAEAVKAHPRISTLRLEISSCSVYTAIKVARALKGNTILRELKITTAFDLNGLKKFLRIVEQNTNIESLTINLENGEDYVPATMLLIKSKKIKYFHIENTLQCNEDAIKIREILQKYSFSKFIKIELNQLEHMKTLFQVNFPSYFIHIKFNLSYDLSIEKFFEETFSLIEKEGRILGCEFDYYGSQKSSREEDIKEILKSRNIEYLTNNWNSAFSLFVVKFLVEEIEVDINEKYLYEWTLLHYAAYNNDVEAIKYLLFRDADRFIENEDGATCWHLISQYGTPDSISLFFPVPINLKDISGNTCLFYAIQSNKVRNVQKILEIPGSENGLNNMFIQAAKQNISLEIIELFLIKGVQFDKRYINCLEANGVEEKIVRILKRYYAVHEELKDAILENNFAVVKSLLENDHNHINPDWKYETNSNYTALDIALVEKYIEISAYLIHRRFSYSQVEIDLLDNNNKELLAKILTENYVFRDMNSVVSHLVSKTKIFYRYQTEYQFKAFIKKAYKTLYGISKHGGQSINEKFLKPILSILEYVNDLQIIYDPERKSVEVIDPFSTGSTAGLCNIKTHHILLGGRGESEADVLGTTIHEFTHLACQIIWENNANPYFASDRKTKEEFQEILNELEEKYQTEPNSLDIIIGRVFKSYSGSKAFVN